MNRLLARAYFNLNLGLWGEFFHRTSDVLRVTTAVKAACEHQAFVSISGARGTGKTCAVRKALAQMEQVRLIEPLRLTRERLHLGDIEIAILRDLSDETPRRGAESRSHQVRRVVGTVSQKAFCVLLLDDAHLLHPATLKGLKRLRELTWLNKSPLLGVVLTGQHDRAASISEVALRMDSIQMQGLTTREIKEALTALLRDKIEASALTLMAKTEQARNWLDLERLIDEALMLTQAQGLLKISKAIIQDVLGETSRALTVNPPDDACVGAFLAEANLANKKSAA